MVSEAVMAGTPANVSTKAAITKVINIRFAVIVLLLF
jgi:hypothetical protein